MKKILLVIVVLVFGTFLWYKFELRPLERGSEKRQKVEITAGSSVSDIADELSEKEIIRSPLAFKVFVRMNGREKGLQAGTFLLRPSMSVAEIVEVLRAGKSEEVSITIPEGWTLKDIDTLFARKGITESGSLIICANSCDFSSFEFLTNVTGLAPRGGKVEGYLFPDTYFVSTQDFVPKFFLERMLTTFRKSVLSKYGEEMAKSGHSLQEIMTMASLIEAETRTDTERPIVAGILWKRYKEGMGLGVDATVRYILDKPSDTITVEDLEVQSPYNTRKFKGLPPGPIASPGLSSVLAALRPEESPYWFYLHDTKGLIHYAVTNEEHNTNRARYLK
ncbi:MAG: endolytic transglycosylase MltG [Candidatus Peribacteraceae bacterium]|nr:endolytic transglycosylase MltG [Candidatus Peribacteraceae bacterium]MDD5074429.1 endolytic transglycosylase MltG [Candidatus Peribacteraceae bacterium]